MDEILCDKCIWYFVPCCGENIIQCARMVRNESCDGRNDPSKDDNKEEEE